jgi:uncharacterized protein (AIM24 family)
MADEINYRLIGDDLQAVIITLDQGERVVAEAGAMMYMQDGIEMQTTLDPNEEGGGMMGKLLGGAKRALGGDSFFMTTFTNQARPPRDVAFAAVTPGKIHPIDLKDWGGKIVAQRDAFLCAARGIHVSVAFSRRLGAGFFGGEGLFFATLTGPGRVILQSMPFSRLADKIIASAPRAGGARKGEGGLGGALGLMGGWLNSSD